MIAAVALVMALTTPACWRPPVDMASAPIVRPFVAPLCTWCPGHRGIELRVVPPQPARAVASGRVTFAGTVVGTRYVVVQLPDGRKVTYGMLASMTVRTGDRVLAGRVLGRSTGRLFLGLRVRGRPEDPQPHLCRRRPARLVPG